MIADPDYEDVAVDDIAPPVAFDRNLPGIHRKVFRYIVFSRLDVNSIFAVILAKRHLSMKELCFSLKDRF